MRILKVFEHLPLVELELGPHRVHVVDEALINVSSDVEPPVVEVRVLKVNDCHLGVVLMPDHDIILLEIVMRKDILALTKAGEVPLILFGKGLGVCDQSLKVGKDFEGTGVPLKRLRLLEQGPNLG